ncbi:MAG: type II toxin-antitoxin system RelE/ParE family toxin [Candidatus Delongbacteria bacterium]|nr:type II toxin-antitoxin system RelE/ParE family toxin [Candidatus Delongbacteria bacterium]MDD4206187.1 type II toxin-antitoxin system RelE/ParE family toxin [Candidatus Delongbacteria bacterium]MDY0017393.1 type II toxin-antitoxin system RelE/ParE family toxin [Candidatus Delongbacteria bacterium]
MSNFRIFETDQFISNIENLPPSAKVKISKKIREYVYKQIAENPYFGLNIKKLRDFSPETWRYRIGTYRLFFEIDDSEKIIYITALSKRKDAY